MNLSQPIHLPPLDARHLRKQSARELLFTSVLFAALALGVLCSALVQSPIAAALLATALGLLSVQLVLVLHDCMHASVFPWPWLHTLIGRLIGAYFFSPFSFLRSSHLDHHRAAGLVEGDPEVLDFTEEHARRSPARGALARIARSPFAALLFAPLVQATHLAEWLVRRFQPAREDMLHANDRAGVRPGLLRGLLLDLLCMAAIWIPIGLWADARGALLRVLAIALVAPFFIGLSLTTLATLPLHTLTAGFSLEALTPRARSFYVARTIDSNPLVRALFFNLSYHLEHHLYPGVSRWELGEMARELRPTLEREAARAGLPLLIHPGYARWYLEHSTREERFNPALDFESFNRVNRRFRGVVLRGESGADILPRAIASTARSMTPLPDAG